MIIDDKPPVHVDLHTGAQVAGLALGTTHRVTLKLPQGEALRTFEFSFERYQTDVVCLSDNAFYDNWRVKRADGRDRCRCTDRERTR